MAFDIESERLDPMRLESGFLGSGCLGDCNSVAFQCVLVVAFFLLDARHQMPQCLHAAMCILAIK